MLGPLQTFLAKELGVGSVPIIAPASHDTGCAVAGVPAEGEDAAAISLDRSGTWSLMGVELAAPIINDKSLRYNYTNEGGVGGSIRFLKNIMGLWLVQECRRYWARLGQEHTYGDLTSMAAQPPPSAPWSIRTTSHSSRRATCHRIERSAAEPARPSLPARASLSAPAWRAWPWPTAARGRLEDILGRRIGTIHIVGGGGAQSRLLSRFTADATGRTVITGPVEATAAGNILVQAVALGHLGSLRRRRRWCVTPSRW